MENLPSKAVGEAKVITFDFSNELAASATLAGPATITKETLVGTDPGAVGLTVGAATVASPLVQALVSGGVDQAVYKLRCSCAATNGEVHHVLARLPVGDTD